MDLDTNIVRFRLTGRSNRDIFDATTASCGTLNMVRALESVGVSRALLAYYWSSYRSVIIMNFVTLAVFVVVKPCDILVSIARVF